MNKSFVLQSCYQFNQFNKDIIFCCFGCIKMCCMNDAMCQIQSTRLAVDLDKPLITRTGKELYPNPLWIKERPGGVVLRLQNKNPRLGCYQMKTSTIYGALMHHVTWDYLLSHILIFGTISLIRKCKEVQGSADKIKIRYTM